MGYRVKVSGYVQHNGTEYAPGQEIGGLTEAEAGHLEKAGVVVEKVAEKPAKPPKLSKDKEPGGDGGEQGGDSTPPPGGQGDGTGGQGAGE